MERLTERDGNIVYYPHCNNAGKCGGHCSICDFEVKVMNKLADYEDAEEQGLLLRLPCKVGSKLWAITSPANYSLGAYSERILEQPQERKIHSITFSKNGIAYHVKDRTYGEGDFGNVVFLTREEAEQALNQKGE